MRNIIKAGKRIERIDIYARLGIAKEELVKEVHRMIPRVKRCGLEYDAARLERICSLVTEELVDYYTVVDEVENIF